MGEEIERNQSVGSWFWFLIDSSSKRASASSLVGDLVEGVS